MNTLHNGNQEKTLCQDRVLKLHKTHPPSANSKNTPNFFFKMIFYNEEKFEFGAFFYSSIKTTRIFKKCYQKLNRIYVYSLKLTKHDRVIDYWCKVDYWYIHPIIMKDELRKKIIILEVSNCGPASYDPSRFTIQDLKAL